MKKYAINDILGFFPFIGWLIPLCFSTESDLSQKNAKTAFVGSLITVVISGVVLFLKFFTQNLTVYFALSLTIVQYILLFSYAIFCIYGIVMTAQKRTVTVPKISSYAHSLNI